MALLLTTTQFFIDRYGPFYIITLKAGGITT